MKKLPLEVQEEVKEILKYWTGCYVMQNEITKDYSVSVGIGITSRYNPNKCVAVLIIAIFTQLKKYKKTIKTVLVIGFK